MGPSSESQGISHDDHDKSPEEAVHVETAPPAVSNYNYVNEEEEPELHARTYFALAAMFLLNFVQVVALQGPPAVLTYIGQDLHDPKRQTWVPNALSLVQAVVGPVISSTSDAFQARKTLLVGCCTLSFIGAAIAPGSKDIYRLIASQTLIGFGFATVPLAYSVPSEIVPRRWRPIVQSCINIAAGIGACLGPIVIGALTKNNVHTGWRNFFWLQMGLWGATVVFIWIGYQPPKRHTELDNLSFWQKLGRLDLPGTALLTTGLTLFLVALNLGGEIFSWTSATVLATLVIGLVILAGFGLYQWKGTKTGILHHDLFRGGKDRGRTFAVCVSLILIEGVMLFAYILFYPIMTGMLFESDPLLLVVRLLPFWIASALSTVVYGYASTKLRTIRSPLFVGFLIYTAGTVGLATIQPSDSTRALIFSALSGAGFGAPLILIVAGVQLSTPHHLMATATAATTSARAVSATVFTAIYSAALNSRLSGYIPDYVANAAAKAGLPTSSIPSFIGALTSNNKAALEAVPGVTPAIIGAGVAALKQAYSDGLRVVFIIAAPFGALACLVCFFIGDMRKAMDYHVDAPVEQLVAKHRRGKGDA
ncbi:putative siderophore iron transporter [Mariannaea sp. PMI_226]|nr:putative siderophore iron transporter [Mariannaea sp. PMI_226]